MLVTELTKKEHRTYEMPSGILWALRWFMKSSPTNTVNEWYWLLPVKIRDQILFKTKKRKSKKQLAGLSPTYLWFDATNRPSTIEKI